MLLKNIGSLFHFLISDDSIVILKLPILRNILIIFNSRTIFFYAMHLRLRWLIFRLRLDEVAGFVKVDRGNPVGRSGKIFALAPSATALSLIIFLVVLVFLVNNTTNYFLCILFLLV